MSVQYELRLLLVSVLFPHHTICLLRKEVGEWLNSAPLPGISLPMTWVLTLITVSTGSSFHHQHGSVACLHIAVGSLCTYCPVLQFC